MPTRGDLIIGIGKWREVVMELETQEKGSKVSSADSTAIAVFFGGGGPVLGDAIDCATGLTPSQLLEARTAALGLIRGVHQTRITNAQTLEDAAAKIRRESEDALRDLGANGSVVPEHAAKDSMEQDDGDMSMEEVGKALKLPYSNVSGNRKGKKGNPVLDDFVCRFIASTAGASNKQIAAWASRKKKLNPENHPLNQVEHRIYQMLVRMWKAGRIQKDNSNGVVLWRVGSDESGTTRKSESKLKPKQEAGGTKKPVDDIFDTDPAKAKAPKTNTVSRKGPGGGDSKQELLRRFICSRDGVSADEVVKWACADPAMNSDKASPRAMKGRIYPMARALEKQNRIRSAGGRGEKKWYGDKKSAKPAAADMPQAPKRRGRPPGSGSAKKPVDAKVDSEPEKEAKGVGPPECFKMKSPKNDADWQKLVRRALEMLAGHTDFDGLQDEISRALGGLISPLSHTQIETGSRRALAFMERDGEICIDGNQFIKERLRTDSPTSVLADFLPKQNPPSFQKQPPATHGIRNPETDDDWDAAVLQALQESIKDEVNSVDEMYLCMVFEQHETDDWRVSPNTTEEFIENSVAKAVGRLLESGKIAVSGKGNSRTLKINE